MLSLALGLAGARLPALQLPARQAGRGLHGRLGQPGARLHARRARAGDELEGGRDDGRDAASCRCSSSRCRSSTPRSSRRCASSRGGRSTRAARTTRSHRLVRGGLSEQRTVVLLAAIAAALGATCLAYSRARRLPDHARRRARHLRPARAVRRLPRRPRARQHEDEVVRGGWMLRTIVLHRRRLLEVLVDFVLISVAFGVAYLLLVHGTGTAYERHVFARRAAGDPRHALPRVHRPRPLPGDLALRRLAGGGFDRRSGSSVSEAVAFGIVGGDRRRSATSPRRVFVLDALLCMVADRRVAVRRACALPRPHDAADRDGRRTLIVGAGRSGRSLAPRAARDAGREGRRLRRRRPAPAPPPAARRARCTAARATSSGSLAAAQPDTVLGHDPERAAPIGSTPSCAPAPQPASRAASSGARPTSTRSSSSAPPTRVTPRIDRLYRAIPLALAFLWLVILYGWQTRGHVTPWLFTDELEAGADLALDRGDRARRAAPPPAGFDTLYAYLLAPFWKIGDVATAYATIKYVGVIVMTSAIFPTYFLARTIVSKPWALFAAVGAVAGPALAYAPFLVEEPAAYPWAALLPLPDRAKALAVRTRWWVIGAGVACLIGPAVRGELAVLIPVYALAALFLLCDERAVQAPPRVVVARRLGRCDRARDRRDHPVQRRRRRALADVVHRHRLLPAPDDRLRALGGGRVRDRNGDPAGRLAGGAGAPARARSGRGR